MSNPVEQGRAFWDDHARRDPLWAILSDPSKTGRRWTLPQFLETGRREISLLMYQLRALGIEVERAAALDFGCGIGRLSQPLAEYFDTVTGVDISPEMIRLANDINAHPDRVHYVCNDRDDLSVLSTGAFSFMYSNVVLQHIQPALAVRYLGELFRVVRSRGVVIFQLPSHRRPDDGGATGPRPMAEIAYRASLRIDGDVPPEAVPGAAIVLAVSITNASTVDWVQEQSGVIRAGNHWLDAASGRMLIQDDGRVTLPARLAPGQSCLVTVHATAPADAGHYQLELDVVHEGISWFGDKGSATARIAVQVGATGGAVAEARMRPELPDALRLPDYSEAPEAGALPMHGVARDEIEALIHRSGARLVHVEIDERSGREWVGYRYFARKL